MRLAGWLMVAALALCAHWFDSDAWRAACACGVFGVLTLGAPRSLRAYFFLLSLLALGVLAVGGVARLLDIVPVLISASVGWLFARTLLGTRRPLIARAIAALDGEEQLADPAVASYARSLTWLWAIYQGVLAAIGAVLALLAAFDVRHLPGWLPGPRAFGALVLPLAVLSLLLLEFALRRRLLPQAPRHHLPTFLRGLLRVWPKLLDEG